MINNKPYIRTEINIADGDQIMVMQPGVSTDCIEVFFKETDGGEESQLFYIKINELPVVIQKLQEMMDYNSTDKW